MIIKNVQWLKKKKEEKNKKLKKKKKCTQYAEGSLFFNLVESEFPKHKFIPLSLLISIAFVMKNLGSVL